MKKAIEKRDILAAVVGGLCGEALAITLVMPGAWLGLFERLGVSFRGGMSESADWGEIAFYMSIVGVPAGLVAAAVTFFAYRRWKKPAST